MPTIGIVHEARIPPKSSRRLFEAAKKLNIPVHYIPIKYIVGKILDNDLNFSIGIKELKVDGILLRGLGFSPSLEQFLSRISILKLIEYCGIRIMNNVDSLILSRNKFMTLLIAKSRGINVPETILSENIAYTYKFIEHWGKYIYKPIIGSRGFGSTLFKDKDIAFQAMKTLEAFNQPLMFQKFIENPGRDIRIMVIGDDIVASMYRIASPSSWKTNIAQGGVGKPYKPVEEVREIAIKISKMLGLDYAGVDILESPRGYVLLEVNGSADFEELTRVSGINIAEKIVQYLVDLIKC